MLKYIYTIIQTILLCCAFNASNAQSFIKLGGSEFPPYYRWEENQLTGAMADILIRIWSEAGYRYSTEQLSTSRLHDGLIRGEIHSTLLASAEAIDAAPSVMRSPLSLAELTLNLYSVDGPRVVRSREELRNAEIIVLRSYGYGGLRAWMSAPEQAIRLHDAYNAETALRMLAARRAPLALLYDVNFKSALQILGEKPAGIHENHFRRIPLYLYLNRDATPNATETMERLMTAYRALVARGALNAPGQRPEDVLPASN